MSDDTIETGLAGLTVTVTQDTEAPSVSPDPKPPVAEPVPHPTLPVQLAGNSPAYKKAPLPMNWDLPRVAELVRDVAHNMYDLPDIIKKHGLTDRQYKTLEQNEFFKRALEQFTIDWHAAPNTQRRLALEAAMAVEAALPTVAARARDKKEPLGEVVALVKVLAEMAGSIGAKNATPATPTEKFKIVINLGGDLVTNREASVSVPDVQSIPEGQSETRSVQSLMQAAGVPAPLRILPQGS